MPAYIEYYSVQKALEKALRDAKDLDAAAEVRAAFETQARRRLHRVGQRQGRRRHQERQRRSPRRVELDPQAAAGRQREPAARVRGDGDALTRRALDRRRMPSTRCATDSATRSAGPSCSRQALTHRSYGATHNERLEFVGDAVLNCVDRARRSTSAFPRFPKASCRACARASSTATRSRALARGARPRRRDPAGRRRASRSGGAERPSILADALEAVFGAVFLDGGFDAARAVDRARATRDELARSRSRGARQGPEDAAAGMAAGAPHRRCPSTRSTAVAGEAHAQTFTVECRIPALAIVAERQRHEPPRGRAGRGGRARTRRRSRREAARGG